jgi:hypothetical protein
MDFVFLYLRRQTLNAAPLGKITSVNQGNLRNDNRRLKKKSLCGWTGLRNANSLSAEDFGSRWSLAYRSASQ